jgi:hypothetical protein
VAKVEGWGGIGGMCGDMASGWALDLYEMAWDRAKTQETDVGRDDLGNLRERRCIRGERYTII